MGRNDTNLTTPPTTFNNLLPSSSATPLFIYHVILPFRWNASPITNTSQFGTNGSNNNIRNPVLNRTFNNDEQGDLTYDDRVTRYQQALGDSTRALNPDRK